MAATPADAPDIARLHHLARETAMPYLPKLHTVDETTRFVGTLLRGLTVLIARRNGRIVGYCAYAAGKLEHLYVDPQCHRQGVGAALLRTVMIKEPRLQLWVFQKNRGAIKFYERFGFRLVRTTDGRDNEEREPDALYACG